MPPLGGPKLRAVKKEQKHYHFNWALVPEEGPRFENMVAAHLLKWVDFHGDSEGRDLELRYFRDVDGREVDFVITEDGQPLCLLECKWSETSVNPALFYLKRRYPKAEAWQISAVGKKDDQTQEGIRVIPAKTFLSTLI